MPRRIPPPFEVADLHVSALKGRETRYRDVFVDAPLPQALVDSDGQFVAANAAFSELVDYRLGELLSLTLGELTHPQDWGRHRRSVEELLRGQRDAFQTEQRYVRQSGDVVHVRNYLRLIPGEGGQTSHVHAMVVDQTAQRAAEAALAASEARVQALLTGTRDAVLVAGSDGLVRSASWSGEQSMPEFARAGAYVFDPLAAADAAAVRAALADVVFSGEPARLTVGGTSDQGERRVWDMRLANRLRDPVLEGIVVTFRDVTSCALMEEFAEGEAAVARELLAGAPRRRVLESVARMIERAWPYVRAAVLLVDEVQGCLRHAAAPSMPDHFVHAVYGLPITEGGGACGTAAFPDAPVIVEDIRTDPALLESRAMLEALGVRGLWALPLHDGHGRVVGTLALYSSRVARPSAGEWQIAQRVVHLASLVIAGVGERGATPEDRGASDVPEPVSALSRREQAVLRLIALGHTNQEVADLLHLSVRTVESHRAALVVKTGAKTRAELVRFALDAGLLRDEMR